MISKFDKIAYEYFQEDNFDKDYWKIVFHLKDKEPEKLKDYEVQFINGYNEIMTLIAENSALKCLIANTPEEEVKKSKEEFLTHYIISEENRQKIRDSVDIGCPVCKAKLVFIKTMRAESLVEHCTSEHVSLKDMYGCPIFTDIYHDCVHLLALKIKILSLIVVLFYDIINLWKQHIKV